MHVNRDIKILVVMSHVLDLVTWLEITGVIDIMAYKIAYLLILKRFFILSVGG